MRWAQRIVGVLLVCVLAFAAAGIVYDNVAHAGDLKDDIVNKVIKEIAKRLYRDRSMTDDQLAERVNRSIEDGFRSYDIYVTRDETNRRISNHCWRAYWMALLPSRPVAYFDGLIPGEYVDDWGNHYNELEVCVRTGWVPRPVRGGIDSE